MQRLYHQEALKYVFVQFSMCTTTSKNHSQPLLVVERHLIIEIFNTQIFFALRYDILLFQFSMKTPVYEITEDIKRI